MYHFFTHSLVNGHLGCFHVLKVKVKVKLLSRVRLFVTPWTVAHQAPLSLEFSRQEFWSGLPFPSPGDLPKPGIEPRSPALQADALTSEPSGKPPIEPLIEFPEPYSKFPLAIYLACGSVSFPVVLSMF